MKLSFCRNWEGLIQQFASTSSQSYSHSTDRFFKKKKIIMNKSSSLLLHLHLHLHLLHFLIMNKSSYLKKKIIIILSKSFKKKKKKEIFKRALGLGALGSYFLGCFQKLKKKKKIIRQSKFSIPWKNSSFPNSKKKKIFIKIFFRNRKLWSFSIFSNDATSSQLSTLSILRSMEYVPN